VVNGPHACAQADEFGPDEPVRCASYKPHPDSGAKEQFYRMLGLIYGSRDAGMRFYKDDEAMAAVAGFCSTMPALACALACTWMTCRPGTNGCHGGVLYGATGSVPRHPHHHDE